MVIPSLIEAGILKQDIHVFSGGYLERSVKVVDEITYYELAHNSFEYSPLIDICENNIESEYWFLLHDTCKAGPNFKTLMVNIPENRPEKVALMGSPAMSIGLYRYDYLQSVKDQLLSIRNTDYSAESMNRWKIWGVPNEDFILWKTSPAPAVYENPGFDIVDHANWYGTETIRRTEYYRSLDLYKNKSNWGQTGENMVVVV